MRRLSPAFLTMVMLGVVGLLVVLYVGKKLLARDKTPPADPTVSVPMSLTDLEPGTRITEAHLATGPAVRSKLTRDIVMTTRALVGRVVKNKIPATQPIKSGDLYAPGQNAPLNLEPGMVAVTVPMSSPFAASRGQYVDVHFTPATDPDQEDTGGRIMTLFKGVKILEISSSSANRTGANVTLELTREQANIILLAKDRGELHFVYAPEGKGTGGVAVNDADRATLYEILGYTPKPAEPAVPPFITEIFEGSGREVVRFRDGLRQDGTFDVNGVGTPPNNTLPPANFNNNRNGGASSGSGRSEGGGSSNNSGRMNNGAQNNGPSASINQFNRTSR